MDMPDRIFAGGNALHQWTPDERKWSESAYVKADLAQSLADALESIAKNTCCEGCQEAAKVAQAALANYRKGE